MSIQYPYKMGWSFGYFVFAPFGVLGVASVCRLRAWGLSGDFEAKNRQI